MPSAADLEMSHLKIERTADVVTAAKLAVQPEAQAPAKAERDPRDEEQWTFAFDWTDARGQRWQGQFTNKILGIDEMQAVAIVKARFLGGMPLSSFTDEMLGLTGIVAHMSVSLEQRPEWAKDLRKIKDANLVGKLWEKVDSHESHYFRLGTNPPANP